ncbi:hypothetical protein N7470_010007 [Penicillium chermesinum]|nr:hypothetical protein N7470_010007 [Penicillium chermesinum]
MAAAQAVLDEIHDPLPRLPDDTNTYVLGSIQAHDIVIACLPTDQYGIINAATVVTNLKRTFPAIRAGLMVGIGGGVPSKTDIRLGDIVVGTRVMQVDLGKIIGNNELERTAIPRLPHQLLGTAVSTLRAKHELGPSKVPAILQERLEKYAGYGYPSLPDNLFQATYHHEAPSETCDKCDSSKLVVRAPRTSNDPNIHYGAVASGSQVIRNSVFRDEVARQLNIICFEMEAAGLMDILPCLPIRGICDYSDSHKNKDWQRYAAATAAAYARELLEELPPTEIKHRTQSNEACASNLGISQKQVERAENQKNRAKQLLDLLRFKQIDARRSTIKDAYFKTCAWFLHHPDYKAWLDSSKLSQHHGFLWIKGKPGAGKSTIMKFAYLNMKRKKQPCHSLTISFFFNARGDYLEKSVLGMYRSLLVQVLEGYPDLQEVLSDSELWSSQGQAHSLIGSINTLKDLLSRAISLLGKRSLTCFIDALDECDEQHMLDMIQYFEQLAETSTENQRALRICFSSRHYPYIIIRRGTSFVLEHQDGHTRDLKAYAESHLRATDPVILQAILEKASGVFMWVVLVVEILNKELARGAMSLEKRLEEIPSDLSALFKAILERDKENMQELLLCFLWILCAERPLKPDEFYHALWSSLLAVGQRNRISSNFPDPSVKDTVDGLPRSHRYVISCSKGLAEVTNSNGPSVQFIHESVRDFLIKDRGLYALWPEIGLDWKVQGHEKLKQGCYVYLTHSEMRCFTTNLNTNLKVKKKNRIAAAEKYPFLQYASQSVLHHANAANSVFSQDDFIAAFDTSLWVKLNNLFEKSMIRKYTAEASLLYILADKGYPELIRTRLKAHPDIHIQGERYNFPIFAALARGDKATFAALLGRSTTICDGVDVTEGLNHRKDLGDVRFLSPLSWAVAKGRASMVKFLLQSSIDMSSTESHTVSSLSIALRVGNLEMANLLIAQGFDVNKWDCDGNTPIHYAIRFGRNDIVRALVQKGANVDVCCNYHTPVCEAVRRGNYDIAEFLLDNGADPNVHPQKNQYAPLNEAAQVGNENLLKLLLDYGASVNARSYPFGFTPLEIAVVHRHENIAMTLIDRGADITIPGFLQITALSRAVMNHDHSMVKLLLSRGADCNAQCAFGRTPVSHASTEDRNDIAMTLIDHGADVNICDMIGYTPLLLAVKNHNHSMIKLLLSKGADCNAQCASGGTPLSHALIANDADTAILLMERGAHFHTRYSHGDSLLHVLVRQSSSDAVKLLIDYGADIEVENDDGETPLDLALKPRCQEDIVKLLVEKGAADNAMNKDGGRPLGLGLTSERGV